MSNQPDKGKRDRGRPRRRGEWGAHSKGQPGGGRLPGAGSQPARSGHGPGPIRLVRLGAEGDDFELVHPRAVDETRLDYEEGIELWKEGDPESARDALRYALSACHENLWVHVALGQIALAEFRDPGAGARALRLCNLSGRACPAARIRRPAAARATQQSPVL